MSDSTIFRNFRRGHELYNTYPPQLYTPRYTPHFVRLLLTNWKLGKKDGKVRGRPGRGRPGRGKEDAKVCGSGRPGRGSGPSGTSTRCQLRTEAEVETQGRIGQEQAGGVRAGQQPQRL